MGMRIVYILNNGCLLYTSITATDYGEGTVNRLRDVLDVDIIKRFDIFNDSFDKLSIKAVSYTHLGYYIGKGF